MSELTDKSRHMHSKITKSTLPRHLKWIGLRHATWKSIYYFLTTTTLSSKESAHLVKKLYMPLLSKLGYNRNLLLLLRYNLSFLIGIGLYDTYVEQEVHKVEFLFTHGGLYTVTGQLIQNSLKHHQLEIGSFNPFLHLPFKDYLSLTNTTWFIVLWEFVCDHTFLYLTTILPDWIPNKYTIEL